jgi:RNA polymerase sigma-70 factor, ECF subfamily
VADARTAVTPRTEPGQHSSPAVRGDELLVRRAQQGEVGAFEGLYRAHVGRVYALCRRMTADPALAEDLTQEAFVRAWEKLATFRGDSAFSTWLHRLAVNVVLGHFRAAERRGGGSATEDGADLADARAVTDHPGAALDLERAIARLPRRARTVFVLHDVEGYRHEEVAALADMAVGTSKAQLSRARRLLREVLSP